MDRAFDGDPAGLGDRVVRAYLELWDDPALSLPLLAMFRSAVSNEHAAVQMRDFLETRILAALAPRLDTDDTRRRITLVGAQLLGVAIARNVMKVPLLAEADIDLICSLFAPAVQATLVPPTHQDQRDN